MRKCLKVLALAAAVAVEALVGAMVAVAAFCDEPRWPAPAESPAPAFLPEVDANGYRCEGDCDASVPCRFCNPRP